MNDLVDRLAVRGGVTQTGARATAAPTSSARPTCRRADDGPRRSTPRCRRSPRRRHRPADRRELGGYDAEPGGDGCGDKLAEILACQARVEHADLVRASPGSGSAPSSSAPRRRPRRGFRTSPCCRTPSPTSRGRRQPRGASPSSSGRRRRGPAAARAPESKQKAGAAIWPVGTRGSPGRPTRRSSCGTARTTAPGSVVASRLDTRRGPSGCSSLRSNTGMRPSACTSVRPRSTVVRSGSTPAGRSPTSSTADGAIAKVPSTPDGSRRRRSRPGSPLSVGGPTSLAHGTTVATNALLERRGATVALVTTAGFADVIEIARQDRPSLYDPFVDRPAPFVPRRLRYEVGGPARGRRRRAVEPVGPRAPTLPDDVEAVAVCLLHADLDAAPRAGGGRTRSRPRARRHRARHEVSPEFREYERTVTTVVNAYLRPACRVVPARRWPTWRDEVLVMTSAGGLVPRRRAPSVPAALLLSGPAGGVRPRRAVAAARAGFPTRSPSTWAARQHRRVPRAGRPARAGGRSDRSPASRCGCRRSTCTPSAPAAGRSPASTPAARCVVGPESAGADAGTGVLRPGRDRADGDRRRPRARPHPGRRVVPRPRSRSTSTRARARSTLAGVDGRRASSPSSTPAMEQALRAVSVERGVDPRRSRARGLRRCRTAARVRAGRRRSAWPAVIVPPRAGVLSAVGLLCAPRPARPGAVVADAGRPRRARRRARDLAASWRRIGVARGRRWRTVDVALDCRYAGQSHELTGRRRSRRSRPSTSAATATPDRAPSIEVVALRATAARRRSRTRRRSTVCPAVGACADGGVRSAASSPSPTARSGCPRVGGPSRARWRSASGCIADSRATRRRCRS